MYKLAITLLATIFVLTTIVLGAQNPPRKLETRFTIYLYNEVDTSGFLTEEQEGMLELTDRALRYFEHRNNRYWFQPVGRSQRAEIQVRLVRLTIHGDAAVVRAEMKIGDFVSTISGRSEMSIDNAATDLIDNVRSFTVKNFFKLRKSS